MMLLQGNLHFWGFENVCFSKQSSVCTLSFFRVQTGKEAYLSCSHELLSFLCFAMLCCNLRSSGRESLLSLTVAATPTARFLSATPNSQSSAVLASPNQMRSPSSSSVRHLDFGGLADSDTAKEGSTPLKSPFKQGAVKPSHARLD